jgi:hypothetical protein
MNTFDEQITYQAILNATPRVMGGGAKLRGPNALADLVMSVWIHKALLLVEHLPQIMENERQRYYQDKKFIETVTKKGTFTGTYGWSPNKDFKWDFNVSPTFYNMMRNIIGPFIGVGKDIWSNENSRYWKRIKKMIIEGDKLKIVKLQQAIKNRILKESKKRVVVRYGTDNTNLGGAPVASEGNL